MKDQQKTCTPGQYPGYTLVRQEESPIFHGTEIGRASCRERV